MLRPCCGRWIGCRPANAPRDAHAEISGAVTFLTAARGIGRPRCPGLAGNSTVLEPRGGGLALPWSECLAYIRCLIVGNNVDSGSRRSAKD